MLNRLRLRYSLYYALPPCRPGEARTVKVELTGEAAAQHPGHRARPNRLTSRPYSYRLTGRV